LGHKYKEPATVTLDWVISTKNQLQWR